MNEGASPSPNPFPGLRPFRSDEHHLFFGREEQTTALLQLLRTMRFLSVVGTSGSGKSSLVRAGLIAELYSGTMTQAGSAWEVVILRPGGSPIDNLAQALVRADLYDAEDLQTLPRLKATLGRSRFGLVEAIKQSDVFEPDVNLLVVVDQFEELFRFRQQDVDAEETAAAFVNLLLTASQQDECPIYVTITMRSDYLGDCSEIPGLAEAVNEGEYLIPRLMRDQKRDAIEKPIGVGGAKISPMLVQKLLNDVGDDPDQLPVLQHALMRMWDVWSSGDDLGRPIDFADLEATGGLAAALSNHADEIYEELPDEQHRHACERIFKSLTEKGNDNRGIRRPTRLQRLQAIADANADVIQTVLDAYRQPGVTFLMPGMDRDLTVQTVLDLSHESLMRCWNRLRGWVEEEAQSARIFGRLLDTAHLWKEGKAGLFRDPDLQIATSWRKQQQPNQDWAELYGGDYSTAIEFLNRSNETAEQAERAAEAARRRELEQAQLLAETQLERLEQQRRAARRLRTMIGGLAVIALIACAACVVAMVANNRAERLATVAAEEAEKARRSASEAEQQRAVAVKAEQSMQALAEQAELARDLAERATYRSTIRLAGSMLNGDEQSQYRVADLLWNTETTLRGWEWGHLMAQCPLEEWSLLAHESGLRAITVSPDKRFLVAVGRDGAVVKHDLETRQAVWQSHVGRANRIEIDPRQRFVAVSYLDAPTTLLDFETGNLLEDAVAAIGPSHRLVFSTDGDSCYTLTGGFLTRWDIATWEQRAKAVVNKEYIDLFVDRAGSYVGVWPREGGELNDPRYSLYNASTLAPAVNSGFDGPKRNNTRADCVPILNSRLGQIICSNGSNSNRHVRPPTGATATLRPVTQVPDIARYLAYDQVSDTVVTAAGEGTIHVTFASGKKRVLSHGAPIVGLALWQHDHFLTAGADGLVKCWTLQTPAELNYNANISPDTASATVVSFANNEQLLFQNWKKSQQFIYETQSCRFQFSKRPDLGNSGQHFPVFRPGSHELVMDDTAVTFYRVDPAKGLVKTRSLDVPSPRCVGFDASGNLVAVSDKSGGVSVVDLNTQQRLPNSELANINTVAIDPSGTRGAALSEAGLAIWEIKSGRLLNQSEISPRKFESPQQVPVPQFHPDGVLVAYPVIAEGGDSRMILWDSTAGVVVASLESPAGVQFQPSFCFSPDGNRLFTGCSDAKVRIWDWRGKMILHSVSETQWPPVVAVSPDGLSLAYGAWQPSLRLAKALPWRGINQRGSAFYEAVDKLRLFSAATLHTAGRITVSFTNRTERTIKLDWVDEKKVRRSLAPLRAGKSRTIRNVRKNLEYILSDIEGNEEIKRFITSSVPMRDDKGGVTVAVGLVKAKKHLEAQWQERLGDVLLKRGDREGAAADYRLATRIWKEAVMAEPANAEFQSRLANLYRRRLALKTSADPDCRKLADEAVAFWKELLQIPNAHAVGWRHLHDFQLRNADLIAANSERDANQSLVAELEFTATNFSPTPEQQHVCGHNIRSLVERVVASPNASKEVLDQDGLAVRLARNNSTAAAIFAEIYREQEQWDHLAAMYREIIGPDVTEYEWDVLEPKEIQSDGGESFDVQKDKSVLVTGTNPKRCKYRLEFVPPDGTISAVRLEALTDSRLPFGAAGRNPQHGHFILGECSIAVGASPEKARAVPIVAAWTDNPVHAAEESFDGNPRTYWTNEGRRQLRNQLVLQFAEPVELSEGETLWMNLDTGVAYLQHGLGRFRVSVCSASLDVAQFAPADQHELLLQQRAEAYERLQDWDAAKVDWLRLAKLNEARIFAALDFIQRAGRDGRTDIAEEMLEVLATVAPKNALLLNALAWNLVSDTTALIHDPELATRMAAEAIELHPLPHIWNTLGVAQYRTGDAEAALESLQKSMELTEGGNSADWFFVAMAESKLDRKEAAYEWYGKAVEWMAENRPQNSELSRFHAEVVATIAPPPDVFLRAVQEYPESWQAMFDGARSGGRWNAAAAIGDLLIEAAVQDEFPWLRQAPVAVLTGDEDRYRDFCSRMIERFEDTQDPARAERICKACLLLPGAIAMDRLPLEILAQSLEKNVGPSFSSPWGWTTRALAAYRDGNPTAAAEYVHKANTFNPNALNKALGMSILALAHSSLGNTKEAKKALDEASELVTGLLRTKPLSYHHDTLIAKILFDEAVLKHAAAVKKRGL